MPRYRITAHAALAIVTVFAAAWAHASEILELRPGLAKTVTTCPTKPGPMKLDRSTRLNPCPFVKSIAIGNPNVAFVNAINLTSFIVTGKERGTTNLILFDEFGKRIYDIAIQVVSGTDQSDDDNPPARREVEVFSGVKHTRTYYCAQNCSQKLSQEEERAQGQAGEPPRSAAQTQTPTTNPSVVVQQNQNTGGAPGP
jgi:Flp pilus assembly secretin CpaC